MSSFPGICPGVYIFHFAPPPRGMGEKKVLVIDWLGKKYDDLSRKHEFKGVEVEKQEKGKILTVLRGKYNIEKRVGGKNIIFSGNIHPCICLQN